MKHQRRHPTLVDGVQGTHHSHQGCATDVHAYLARVQVLLQLTGYITEARVELNFLDAEFDLTPDHLQRLIKAFPVHGRAQDVMAVDNRLQGLGEGIQMSAALERELALQYVRIALLCGNMMIENAFL